MAEGARPSRFTTGAGETVEVAPVADGRYRVTLGGRSHLVRARRTGPTGWRLEVGTHAADANVTAAGDAFSVEIDGRTRRIQLTATRRTRPGSSGDGDRELRAAMPGKVVAVAVREGDTVARGQHLFVIEAMKMENDVLASRAGVVEKLRVRPGQAVESGELLAVIA